MGLPGSRLKMTLPLAHASTSTLMETVFRRLAHLLGQARDDLRFARGGLRAVCPKDCHRHYCQKNGLISQQH